jgi:uncharacterized membrane protein
MEVLWWFAGVVLIALSLLLWVAGLTGKEGVLRIGRETAAGHEGDSKTQVRPVKTSNVALGIVGILVGLTVILVFAL